MKQFHSFLAMMSLVLLIGYIVYNESGEEPSTGQREITTEEKTGAYELGKTVSYDLPEKMEFAGERVPLEIPDVRERLDREIHINVYWHNNTIFLIKRAYRWLPQIEEILKKNGIPEDFKYMSVIESSLINDVSYKNAVGFWQFLRGTAKEFGLEVNREVDERYHPIKSTEAACRYLKKSYEKFGNWTIVAASYDRGRRGIERALDHQKVDSYYDLLLNDETSRYVFRILAAKEILENPSKYGFDISQEHLYQKEPVTEIEITNSIDDLVRFSKDLGINYKILKRHNPWLRTQKLTVRGGEKYEILIPVEASRTKVFEKQTAP